MEYMLEKLAREREPLPVQAGHNSAIACVHLKPVIAIIAIAAIALVPNFRLRAQSKVPSASKTGGLSDDAQLYRNNTFGFRYRVPYGWVDRSKEMQENDEAGRAQVLLAAFERPPEAIGDSINSAVVIAFESAASYPGLKRDEDYVGPLTDLATAQGFQSEGEPYALQIDSRKLLRVDFAKKFEVATKDGKSNDARSSDVEKDGLKTSNDKLTMRQCSLVWLARGEIVSFTFIAGSADEIDDLVERLHFVSAKSPAH